MISEIRRVTILASVAVFFLITFIIVGAFLDKEHKEFFSEKIPEYWIIIFFVFITCFQLALRFFFSFLLKNDIKPLFIMRYVNIVFEMSFPSFAIIIASTVLHPVYALQNLSLGLKNSLSSKHCPIAS